MADLNNIAETIQHHLNRGDATGWFEVLYARANGDPRAVPWAHTSPRKELVEWAREQQPDGAGQPALVIGCGLGDDAEFLAGLNYRVTAFDVSKTAIEWCRRRFPRSTVNYQVANMFEPPADWLGAFDLVVEVYIVQALPPQMRRASIETVAAFVAPGGALLAIGHGIEQGHRRNGPPWALYPQELAMFEESGLELRRCKRRADPAMSPKFRYRAEYRRPNGRD